MEAESQNSETTGGKQNKPWLFKPGESGNPNGRPKGTFSPLTVIRKKFEENPEYAKEWLDKYLEDPKNRQHLINQLEGMPKQRTEVVGDVSLPFVIKIIKDGEGKGEDS